MPLGATVTRTVVVELRPSITPTVMHRSRTYEDSSAPIGDTNVTHEAGSDYTVVTRSMAPISGVGEVDDQVQEYTLTLIDTVGNTATVTRTVVVEDTSAPVITLIGDTNVTHVTSLDDQ